ncbi:MAG: hypothetical protein JSW46_05310 [Gemmatimonadota bacterium]|nr:MAG: hypothetical protein JSW46_05310 [Gemmatimonadota bacterium]
MRKPNYTALMAFSAALAAALAGGCADGLEPVPFQGVSGRVAYQSEPPAGTTDWVRLAVYVELPQTEFDLLDFVTFSDTLLSAGEGSPYAVALEPGEYAFLVVVWKEAGNDNLLTALRAAGWYSGGGGPFDMPAPFAVAAESETADTDLSADFDTMLTIQEVLALLNP